MTRKLGMRRGEDRGGCMWRLMSKLHLRRGGSTQKLLSGSNRCMETAAGYEISRKSPDLMARHGANINDGERTVLMATGSKASIRTLVEEEMMVDAGTGWSSLKRGKQPFDRVMDDDNESSWSWTDEQSFTDDVREITEYLGSVSQQRSGTWEDNGHYRDEMLSRALRKALCGQLVNGRRLSEEETLCCSKVFMDMLRVLNSVEFSLLELLRDPEAMLTKCMEILKETRMGRLPSKRSAASSISRRKEEGNPFQMNVGSPLLPSRIVILKPWMVELPKPAAGSLNPSTSQEIKRNGTKGQKRGSVGPGFLSDIKRKLKNIVAKDFADESAARIDEKLRKGCGGRSSERQPSSRSVKDKPSRISARRNNYLPEAITVDEEDGGSSSRDPETMGMILLRPELNYSLQTIPGRRWGYGAADQNTRSSSRIKSRIVGAKWRKHDFVELADTDMYAFKFLAEDIPPASNGDDPGIKVDADSTEESSLGIASSRETEKDDEDMETAIDLPERPSPVSVLEPHFSLDDVVPEIFGPGMNVQNLCSTEGRQHLEMELEEADDSYADELDAREGTFEDSGLVLDRVASLLGTSDLTWEDLYLKSQSSGQQSLFRDRHLFKDDTEYLIDCVREVLLETCACFIGRSCLSLTRQRIKPVPSMDFIVHKVCRGVKWHLDPIPHPRSLEQIIGKDMSRTGSWMDLTYTGESIVFKLGDAIFSELLDEITNPVGIRGTQT